MDITNTSGSDITIDSVFLYWEPTPASQKVQQLLLDGALIWNPSDPDSPTDIPAEGNWINGANRTILNGATSSLGILFSQDLQASGYELHVIFNSLNCQVSGSQ